MKHDRAVFGSVLGAEELSLEARSIMSPPPRGVQRVTVVDRVAFRLPSRLDTGPLNALAAALHPGLDRSPRACLAPQDTADLGLGTRAHPHTAPRSVAVSEDVQYLRARSSPRETFVPGDDVVGVWLPTDAPNDRTFGHHAKVVRVDDDGSLLVALGEPLWDRESSRALVDSGRRIVVLVPGAASADVESPPS